MDDDIAKIVLISALSGALSSMLIMMTWGSYFIQRQRNEKATPTSTSAKPHPNTDIIDEQALEQALKNESTPRKEVEKPERIEQEEKLSSLDTHSNLTEQLPQVQGSFDEMNIPSIESSTSDEDSQPFSMALSQMKPQIIAPKDPPSKDEAFAFEDLNSEEVEAISDPLPMDPETLPEPDDTEDEATVLMHRAPPK